MTCARVWVIWWPERKLQQNQMKLATMDMHLTHTWCRGLDILGYLDQYHSCYRYENPHYKPKHSDNWDSIICRMIWRLSSTIKYSNCLGHFRVVWKSNHIRVFHNKAICTWRVIKSVEIVIMIRFKIYVITNRSDITDITDFHFPSQWCQTWRLWLYISLNKLLNNHSPVILNAMVQMRYHWNVSWHYARIDSNNGFAPNRW